MTTTRKNVSKVGLTKVKVTVSLDKTLLSDFEKLAIEENRSKSNLMEIAARLLLNCGASHQRARKNKPLVGLTQSDTQFAVKAA